MDELEDEQPIYKYAKPFGKKEKVLFSQGAPALSSCERSRSGQNEKKTAMTGLQIAAIDIDQDGDIDLVCPGKSGLYLFENLGR